MNAEEGGYDASAGLNLLSGVAGYMAAQSASSMYKSQADMLRVEAETDAQRYSEQAQQYIGKQEVGYLSSGVTLKGSPVDALATSARVAGANVQAILMQGDTAAMDKQTEASNAQAAGFSALMTGFAAAAGNAGKANSAAGSSAAPSSTPESTGMQIDSFSAGGNP